MSAVEVPLRRRDGSVRALALVDAEDAEAVLAHSWHLSQRGYVERTFRVNGTHRVCGLHRFVLGLQRGDGLEADHINGDKLDNRRANLRVCTHALNQQNRARGANRGASSRVRGVSWDRFRQHWKAHAQVEGRSYHLGYFDTEEQAAVVAAEFRARHMPFSSEANGGA